MTARPNVYILLGTVFILLTWLFVGIYRDDEFYEQNLFTKYRPTFKVNFHSAIGMQDLKLDDLSENRKAEEIAFQEFLIKQQVQSSSNAKLWYLPFILIQLTLTFISLGILKFRRDLVYKEWHFPAHFTACLLLTSIGLGLMLSFDNSLTTIFVGLLVLTLNYGALILITKERRKKSYT
ncbi:hypothetical protein GS399_00010 [Pedobacter sp. HMF7647]|uniref:Uncharacterized protein n=1 Tax=Hufsiella arboris TaxID=2695275 RepID=A0A7K1Y417_9SPHI|nr:hypothetical protein [Hufsiella arboris]MXV49336.1 hypothetical protein [Hufsiella arboris]